MAPYKPEHVERDPGFDVAQICLNGHCVNEFSVTQPKYNQDFCAECGAKTVTDCESCQSKLRGYALGSVSISPYKVPAHCHACGKPYPWTDARSTAAKELADLLDELTENEKEVLKHSIDEMLQDTAQASVAAVRFKKLVHKAGVLAGDAFRNVLRDFLSDGIRKILWP